jgi:hypothetical protein
MGARNFEREKSRRLARSTYQEQVTAAAYVRELHGWQPPPSKQVLRAQGERALAEWRARQRGSRQETSSP